MSADAQSTFAAIADSLRGEPDITEGTGFGSNAGLRVRGKIFAMLADDGMVVKLPAERCSSSLPRDGRGRSPPARAARCASGLWSRQGVAIGAVWRARRSRSSAAERAAQLPRYVE